MVLRADYYLEHGEYYQDYEAVLERAEDKTRVTDNIVENLPNASDTNPNSIKIPLIAAIIENPYNTVPHTSTNILLRFNFTMDTVHCHYKLSIHSTNNNLIGYIIYHLLVGLIVGEFVYIGAGEAGDWRGEEGG